MSLVTIVGFDSKNFVLDQLENGWVLEASHFTKDVEGDWMLNHEQLEEWKAVFIKRWELDALICNLPHAMMGLTPAQLWGSATIRGIATA